jgi:phosphoglycolate phosphatase
MTAARSGSTAPVAGIVFDLDGTLIDSAADIARGVNAMLAEHGLPAQPVAVVERYIGEGTRALVAGVYEGMGVAVSDERLDADTATYLAHYAAHPVVDSALYHDAREALQALRAAGVVLGACTNKSQHMAEVVLDALGLTDLLGVVVGGDVLPVRKPEPGHLLETLRRMGVAPERAVFVGDTVFDVDCARRAGVACVLVGWAAPGVGDGVVDRRIDRFAELLDLVPAAAGADHHASD